MIKALLIYNPCAGVSIKRPSVETILSFFPKNEIDIECAITDSSGAEKPIKQFGKNKDLIVVCGGDGTLNEAISGVIKNNLKIPIGYIPIGSTNDFASALNIPCDLKSAIELIKNGEVHSIDIGRLNDRYFNYVACFGPGTSISYNTSQKFKNIIGYPAYILNGFVFKLIPTIKEVKPKHMRIKYDGKVIDDYFYFGAVSNATTVAGMIKYDKNDVVLNDGKFEVILVKKIKNTLDIFKMFSRIVHRDYDNDSLLYFKTNDIEFEFDTSEDWSVDGEIAPNIKNVDIGVLNKRIEILCYDNPLIK